MRSSPLSSGVRASQPSTFCARSLLAYQSFTSQRRAGIVKLGRRLDAEQLACDLGQLADRGLAAGADVERVAVVVLAQLLAAAMNASQTSSL